jgi:hypothetical protein
VYSVTTVMISAEAKLKDSNKWNAMRKKIYLFIVRPIYRMRYCFLIAKVYGNSSCVSRKDRFQGDHYHLK